MELAWKQEYLSGEITTECTDKIGISESVQAIKIF